MNLKDLYSILTRMQSTPLQIGERVQPIPFKHKNKLGEIKFIGEIEGKNPGTWIGIELDEPKGENNGDFNGQVYFECKPGHGIFFRPPQVKSLSSSQGDVSSIMKMDESLISGMENIGSLIGSTNLDLKQVEKNLNIDPTSEVRVQEIADATTPTQPPQAKQAEAGGAKAGGRIKNWQERLNQMRQAKEQQKKQLEESRLTTTDATSSAEPSMEEKETMEKMKDVLAPTRGLERDKEGKLQVDKEKVEEKKEPVFEPKKEPAVAEESKKEKDPKDTKAQPAEKATPKRLTLAERQAKADAERKAAQDAKKAEEAAKGGTGGLKAPSRLAKPTPAALKATEERKQKLLEKQQAVNARRQEERDKAKAGGVSARGVKSSESQSRLGLKPKVGPLATGAAAAKAGEDRASRLGSARKSISGPSGISSRFAQGRQSIRPGDKPSSPGKEGAQTSRESGTACTSRARGTSSSKNEISGLNKTRRSSIDRNADLQFGKRDRSSTSKERNGLAFGKAKEETVKLDPNMTTVNKKELKELQDQKEENEKHKDELYNLNIKYKKLEFQLEQLKRDHKDEVEKLEIDLNEKHHKAHEDLIHKYTEERNELIKESNKSNDSKFNDLKFQYEELQQEKEQLMQKLEQTIADMTETHNTEMVDKEKAAEQKLEALKAELTAMNEEVKKNLQESNEKIVQFVEKVTRQKNRIEELEEENQAQKMDIEANMIEIELVRDENKELIAEMTENSKIQEEEILNTLSNDEIKQQNRRLRQAVTSLAQQFETEKAKLQKQIEDEEGKKKIIAEYEKKLVDMDVLLEELDRKEQELAEMKIENEMCLEYETMVEEMAQEILKKEEELEEAEKKNRGLEEVLAIQEGYSEQLEQYNQELHEELAEKDAEFSQMEVQKQEDEEILLDLEDENKKYREKVQQQNKTIKELSEELEQYTSNTDEKNKIQQLVEKQNALIKQLGDSEKQGIDEKLQKIEYHWENLVKSKVIEAIIPPRLEEDVRFDSLKKVSLLNQALYRGMMLFRFLCEKQMPNVVNLYSGGSQEEEVGQKFQFVRTMIALARHTAMFVNSAQRIQFCLCNMSIEQYIRATTTLMAWKKFEEVYTEMGHIIEKLKDENLVIIFDSSILEGLIIQITELHIKIEKQFIEKSPEEVQQEKLANEGKEDDKSNYQLTQAQLDRQKLVNQCHKNDLRNQAMKMCYATIAVQSILGGMIEGGSSMNQTFIKKTTLVYGRLLDIIFKLDHIDAQDTGKEFLNIVDLNTDKRLLEKFEVMQVIWSDVADPEQVQNKDWDSVFDAVQRDITQIQNDYKFKRLIKHIESSYKEEGKTFAMNIDQIFYIDRFKNDTVPWMEISKRIRSDIQNSEALKDKIEQLKSKNKQLMKDILTHERTIGQNKAATINLEKKYAMSQTKIEELNSVKVENEQMTKKHANLTRQLENTIGENSGLKKNQEELIKKCEELQKKLTEAPQAPAGEGGQATYEETLGNFRKKRQMNPQSRQSRASSYFQQLANTHLLGGRKVDSTMTPQNTSATRAANMKPINSVEVQRHLQQQEDNYINIIYQLQSDRMRLRGKDITERLNKMRKTDGALNKFINDHSEQTTMNMKLSREKQNQLSKAVETVDNLRIKVKQQMASVKIIDLKKQQEDLEQAQLQQQKAQQEAKFSALKKMLQTDQSQPNQENIKTNTNINYMIMQARDQVNQALMTLMSKDSKLSAFHIDKAESQEVMGSTDEDSQGEEEKEKKQPNVIKIGEIRIKSKGSDDQEKVKTKNIVFNVKSLRSLQSNIGVFSV